MSEIAVGDRDNHRCGRLRHQQRRVPSRLTAPQNAPCYKTLNTENSQGPPEQSTRGVLMMVDHAPMPLGADATVNRICAKAVYIRPFRVSRQ